MRQEDKILQDLLKSIGLPPVPEVPQKSSWFGVLDFVGTSIANQLSRILDDHDKTKQELRKVKAELDSKNALLQHIDIDNLRVVSGPLSTPEDMENFHKATVPRTPVSAMFGPFLTLPSHEVDNNTRTITKRGFELLKDAGWQLWGQYDFPEEETPKKKENINETRPTTDS